MIAVDISDTFYSVTVPALCFIRTAGCHRLSRACLVAAIEGLMAYYCKPLRTEHDLNT